MVVMLETLGVNLCKYVAPSSPQLYRPHAGWCVPTLWSNFNYHPGLLELFENVCPNWSMAWVTQITASIKSVLGDNPAAVTFFCWFSILMISSLVYYPVSIPSFFSFRMKCQNHQLMLEQMASFDVRAAKCTVAADREAIEQQVKELFRQSEKLQDAAESAGSIDDAELQFSTACQLGEESGDAALDRFNAYVRGTLREFVIEQVGNELHVPYRICLTAFLPMIFYSSVNILACDNGPCSKSAALGGYSSVAQYMIAQTIGWTISILMAYPLTYPTLLRMIKHVLSCGDGPLTLVMAFLCCPLAYLYSVTCASLVWAAVVSATQNYSPTQLFVLLFVIALLAAQVSWVFGTGSREGVEGALLSCRGIRREHAMYDPLTN